VGVFGLINFSKLTHIGDCEEHDVYIQTSQSKMFY